MESKTGQNLALDTCQKDCMRRGHQPAVDNFWGQLYYGALSQCRTKRAEGNCPSKGLSEACAPRLIELAQDLEKESRVREPAVVG